MDMHDCKYIIALVLYFYVAMIFEIRYIVKLEEKAIEIYNIVSRRHLLDTYL